ncbi:hypothetical protein ACFDR9_000894 [Janthinobacterium sp. CG_23.3]|uniref:hypothetical protein n=1 Tax=unclassified Janthinobacterium TaxID=2610881 RepID=UPI000344E2FB|nr:MULTISPECIES: hypothetical protein [unclassified Janthinobacterium]MEC5162440.1 hypothetical protein [Janthinobacterium sp. CG_S6]
MVDFKKLALIAALGASLSACYVVPINQTPQAQPAPAAVAYVPAPVQLPVLTARLYPTNDQASSIGRLSGTISRPERGHGVFTLMAGNETYSGEATRAQNSAKGNANAAGNRGGYIKCDYTMSSATMGAGTCEFSNKARFDMHITE